MGQITGSLAAVGNTVSLVNTNPDKAAIIELSGTYAGITVIIETSTDGAGWSAYPGGGLTIPKNTFTPSANETKYIRVVGLDIYNNIRVRATDFTSGSMSVTITSFPAADSSVIGSSGGPAPSTTLGSSQPFSVPTSGAYTANQVVGGPITLSGVNYAIGRRVNLRGLILRDKSANGKGLDVYFLSTAPIGTYTDKTSFTWNASDVRNIVGQFSISSTFWETNGGVAVADLSGIVKKMAVAGTALSMIIATQTGSTPTFNNGDLSGDAEFDQE